MNIYMIRPEQADMASSLLLPEVTEAIKEGLPVTSLIATDNGRAVGALAGGIDDEGFHIVSLYVHPTFRRKGVAHALVEKLMDILEDQDVLIRVDYTRETAEQDSLRPFLVREGFYQDEKIYPAYYIATLDELKGAWSQSGFPRGYDLRTFSDLSEDLLRKASNEAIERETLLWPGGLLSEEISEDLSLAVLQSENVSAYAALQDKDAQLVSLEEIWAGGLEDRLSGRLGGSMVEHLEKEKGSETKIAFAAVDEESEEFINRVMPNKLTATYSFRF